MTTKQLVIHAIEELPGDASWEDIQDRNRFVIGVRKAFQELDQHQGIAHEEIEKEFSSWHSK